MREMPMADVEPDVNGYTAGLVACEAQCQWDLAVLLMRDLICTAPNLFFFALGFHPQIFVLRCLRERFSSLAPGRCRASTHPWKPAETEDPAQLEGCCSKIAKIVKICEKGSKIDEKGSKIGEKGSKCVNNTERCLNDTERCLNDTERCLNDA